MTQTQPSDILKPGTPLPADALMIAKALEILEQSPHGQQLTVFAKQNDVQVKIISTPQATAYLPETHVACIGFNRNNPISPPHFILLLAGLLREAQQESEGIKHPDLHAPKAAHTEVSMAKEEDKVWYMCTVASELNAQPNFTEYYFLDELGKMGYTESLELFQSKG